MKKQIDIEGELALEAIKNGLGYFRHFYEGRPAYEKRIDEAVRTFMETAFAEDIVPDEAASRSTTIKRVKREKSERELKRLAVREKVIEAKLSAGEGEDLSIYDEIANVLEPLSGAEEITPEDLIKQARTANPGGDEERFEQVAKKIVERQDDFGVRIVLDETEVERFAANLAAKKISSRLLVEKIGRESFGWRARQIIDAVVKRQKEFGLHIN